MKEEAGYYPKSKVEVNGFMAAHYDAILNMATFGRYTPFIEKAIGMMSISPQDKILDLGAGTGRNACLMMKYLSGDGGELVGIDICDDMISQFQKRCRKFPNAEIIKARVDQPLPFTKKFDKVFISFVLHGFPQEVREKVINSVFGVLKEDGIFFVLDYNEFSYKKMPFYAKMLFKLIECPYAFDFIKRDWRKILAKTGFKDFEQYIFFDYIRLLKAYK
ncbi:MAG: class I SAM-dependent methyltransferase [Methanophagales archaeon]|nr:class I SAM-dependent methyltransferase [Methanophagales archaeon]